MGNGNWGFFEPESDLAVQWRSQIGCVSAGATVRQQFVMFHECKNFVCHFAAPVFAEVASVNGVRGLKEVWREERRSERQAVFPCQFFVDTIVVLDAFRENPVRPCYWREKLRQNSDLYSPAFKQSNKAVQLIPIDRSAVASQCLLPLGRRWAFP